MFGRVVAVLNAGGGSYPPGSNFTGPLVNLI